MALTWKKLVYDEDVVLKTLFDANTILAANSDNTPAAVTIAEQQVVGRITSGNIKGLSVAELQALVGGGFDPTTTAEIMEDFAGGNTFSGYIGTCGWKFTTGGGGTVTYTSAVSNRVAVIKFGSGTTQDNGSTLYLVDAANQPIIPASPNNLTLIFSVCQVDANASHKIHIGTSDNIALIGDVNGAYFRFNETGNWYAVTRNVGAETATDTGIVNSTSWRQFKIVTASDYSNIKFYIDGVLKATHTTNLPMVATSPRMQVVITATTERFLLVDYFYLKMTGLSR